MTDYDWTDHYFQPPALNDGNGKPTTLLIVLTAIAVAVLFVASYHFDQWYWQHTIRNAVKELQHEGTIPDPARAEDRQHPRSEDKGRLRPRP